MIHPSRWFIHSRKVVRLAALFYRGILRIIDPANGQPTTSRKILRQ
ncbi:MAG: hypothetical protein ACRDGA_06775 [Bacteroidota bacterium]